MKRLIKKFYHNRFLNFLMPTLVYSLKNELKDCHTVLDLGCGPSSPLKHCKNVKFSVGVEAFDDYLKRSRAQKIHSEYLNKQISDLEFEKDSFDAVILIEVIEHLPEEAGEKILKKAEKWAKKKIIVSSPNGFVPQEEVDNNPWQKHVSGWDHRKMKKLGFRSRGLAGLKALRQEVESKTMGDDLISSMRFSPKAFWFVIATLSQAVTNRVPALAFELFSVKNKRK